MRGSTVWVWSLGLTNWAAGFGFTRQVQGARFRVQDVVERQGLGFRECSVPKRPRSTCFSTFFVSSLSCRSHTHTHARAHTLAIRALPPQGDPKQEGPKP